MAKGSWGAEVELRRESGSREEQAVEFRVELRCKETEAGKARREAGAGGGIFTQRKSSQGEPVGAGEQDPVLRPHLQPARPGLSSPGAAAVSAAGPWPPPGVGAGGLGGCGAASLRGARLGAAGGTRLKVAPPPPPALLLRL